jgi:hypothetical protein
MNTGDDDATCQADEKARNHNKNPIIFQVNRWMMIATGQLSELSFEMSFQTVRGVCKVRLCRSKRLG